MKKLFVLLVVSISLLTSCNKNADSASLLVQNNNGGAQAANIQSETAAADDKISSSLSSDAVIEIKEKMFTAQISDIYMNPEDYLGKTIKYEGIFDIYTWEEENQTYYSVIRYGPGCCGDDGNVGFEVVWDGDYPEDNDWVEAVGILERHEANGWEYLLLNLTSLTVLPTRGEEYVTQ